MKKNLVVLAFLLLSSVVAFGVSPGVQTFTINPKLAPKDEATLRVYWNAEPVVKAAAQIEAANNLTDEWLFIKPTEFELGPGSRESPDKEVVWVYADVPKDAPEGTYKFKLRVSTEPLDESGFLSVRQEAASTLNLIVNYTYTPVNAGWTETEKTDLDLNIPMVAGAVVLIGVALFIFMKL